MADWPNVGVTGRIAPLLAHIKRVNVPQKVTTDWLEGAGFKSKNDRALIGLLKGLGYIDGSGIPTDKWAELRGSDDGRKASVGRQMRLAYPQVFANYPDDHIRDALTKEELRTFIRPKVTFGDETTANVVDSFFALRALASFDAAPAAGAGSAATVTVAIPAAPAVAPAPAAAASGQGTVNVSVNLSLELPVTTDADVYDKLFEAMAKHLGSLVGRGK